MLIVHDINDRTVLLAKAVELFCIIGPGFVVHAADILGHRYKCVLPVFQIKSLKTYPDSQHEQQRRQNRKGSKEKACFFAQ